MNEKERSSQLIERTMELENALFEYKSVCTELDFSDEEIRERIEDILDAIFD